MSSPPVCQSASPPVVARVARSASGRQGPPVDTRGCWHPRSARSASGPPVVRQCPPGPQSARSASGLPVVRQWSARVARVARVDSQGSRYQHRTVYSDQTHRMHCSFEPSPNLLRTRLVGNALGRRPTLASPSARRRAKQMLALVAELRSECCRAPDQCFLGVTAATVGRTARQPERRRCHIQSIATRRV